MCVVDGERKRWRESVRSRAGGGGGGGGGGRVRRKDRLGEKSRRWSEGKVHSLQKKQRYSTEQLHLLRKV